MNCMSSVQTESYGKKIKVIVMDIFDEDQSRTCICFYIKSTIFHGIHLNVLGCILYNIIILIYNINNNKYNIYNIIILILKIIITKI